MKHILAISCMVALAVAHTTMTGVIINGQTRTDCMRPMSGNRDGVYDGFPLMDNSAFPQGINSNNYTCGFLPYAAQAATAKCTIAAGSAMTGTYYHGQYGDETELDQYIARSHKGPIMVSMAKSETGAGNVWFKIYQEGLMTYDASNYNNNKWASPDLLIANAGKVNFQIPSDITPGNYLLRFELLALHSATVQSGAQPYVRCVELTVTGSGTSNPGSQHLMTIPSTDYATLNHKGVLFNLYQSPLTDGSVYTYPGTQTVYTAAATGSTPTPPPPTPPSSTPPPPSASTASPPPPSTTPTSCTVGAKGCPCTTGGACDDGLSCVDKVCLLRGSENTAASFAASFPLIAAAGAAVCLATL